MTKIFITVDGDTRSRDGRNIRVKVITDNELVNIQLKAPFTWSKTFPRGTNMKDIRKDMISNIKGIVRKRNSRSCTRTSGVRTTCVR